MFFTEFNQKNIVFFHAWNNIDFSMPLTIFFVVLYYDVISNTLIWNWIGISISSETKK